MDSSFTTVLSSGLRTLPADGAERHFRLHRLADQYAAAEASRALRAAASRARETGDVLGELLSAAEVLCADGKVRPLAAESDASRADARRRMARVIVSNSFDQTAANWISELRDIANRQPSTGACTVATTLQLWTWTLSHVLRSFDVVEREVALGELAESLSRLIAARAHVLSVSSAAQPFFLDLCHVHTAEAAGAVGASCAELVFGHRTHPAWDGAGCATCFRGDDLDELEGLVPGIASSARAYADVIEADGSHVAKAGPCATLEGVDAFARLRTKLDGCLTGARLAKRRAADALPGMAV